MKNKIIFNCYNSFGDQDKLGVKIDEGIKTDWGDSSRKAGKKMGWMGQIMYGMMVVMMITLSRYGWRKMSAMEKRIEQLKNQKPQVIEKVISGSSVVDPATGERSKPVREFRKFVKFDECYVSSVKQGRVDYGYILVNGQRYSKGDFTPYGRVERLSKKMILFRRDDGTMFFFVNHSEGNDVPQEPKKIKSPDIQKQSGSILDRVVQVR